MTTEPIREPLVRQFLEKGIQGVEASVKRVREMNEIARRMTADELREGFQRLLKWVQASDIIKETEKGDILEYLYALMHEEDQNGRPAHYIR